MPRNPNNRNEFIAGMLPVVEIEGKKFYVDGRLEQLRNVEDFNDSINCVDDDIWELLSPKDRNIVIYEFMGETIN